jgi:hypothetical protein
MTVSPSQLDSPVEADGRVALPRPAPGSRSGVAFEAARRVNHRNYFYDLADDPEGLHNHLTPRIREENEAEIRRQIGEIDGIYHFTPPK